MNCIVRLTTALVLGVLFSAIVPAVSGADGTTCLLASQAASGELTGWKSFHDDPQAKTADVWRLDAEGVLHCKGNPKGYLYTDKDYASFLLTLEWRWPVGKKAGNGGVLVRMTGANKIWPKSLEAQLNAGDAGDFWGLDGYCLSGPAERSKSLRHPQFGVLTHLKKTTGLEKAPGQWNCYEIRAEGSNVTLSVNGQVVNQATGCDTVPGRLCLTAEGDEIEFRNIRLTPIGQPK